MIVDGVQVKRLLWSVPVIFKARQRKAVQKAHIVENAVYHFCRAFRVHETISLLSRRNRRVGCP